MRKLLVICWDLIRIRMGQLLVLCWDFIHNETRQPIVDENVFPARIPGAIEIPPVIRESVEVEMPSCRSTIRRATVVLCQTLHDAIL